MDGTLRNISPEGIFMSWDEVCNRFGIDRTGIYKTMQECLQWSSSDWHQHQRELRIPSSSREQVRDIFTREYIKHVHLFDWAPALIKYYASKDIELSVWTSSTEWSIHESLGDLKKYFSQIIGAESLDNLKPHPQGGEIILAKSLFPSEQTLMIGDDVADFKAAQGCGMKMCPVLWGASGFSDIATLSGFYRFLSHPRQLFDLV